MLLAPTYEFFLARPDISLVCPKPRPLAIAIMSLQFGVVPQMLSTQCDWQWWLLQSVVATQCIKFADACITVYVVIC